jgi:hypothetical protein
MSGLDLGADTVTRFEVIDHTRNGGVTYSTTVIDGLIGRSVTALGVSVTLSLQDDGKTLKVFLSDRA